MADQDPVLEGVEYACAYCGIELVVGEQLICGDCRQKSTPAGRHRLLKEMGLLPRKRRQKPLKRRLK